MLKRIFTNKLNVFKKYIKQMSGHSTGYFFFVALIQVMLFSKVYSETITISGKISSNRIPIRNASVIFVDMADTTSRVSTLTDNAGRYQIDLITSGVSESNGFPKEFELAQNYPNPFSGSTAIPYKIKTQSDIAITIYDVLGRKVRGFTIGVQSVGAHHLIWDGRDESGIRAANGVYLYKIQSNGKSIVRKMILDPNGYNSIIIPNMQSYSYQSHSKQMNKATMTEGNVYTIRIDNSSTTSPLLVPEKLESVTIQNDTTINFSVTYTPLASLDFDSLHQIIQGYGAAGAWYLPAATDSEMESAFGTDKGQIGLTIYRIPVESNSNIWSKWVPSTKKAYEMGAKIIASPWYAPAALTETVAGKSRVRHDKYGEYVDHLNSFVKYMEDNGVPVYGISVSNEPEYGENWTGWAPDEMLTFMKDYAHLIEGTLVMAPESFQFRKDMSDPILNDPVACANTDIICGHIYGGGLSKYPLAEEKGKEVWMTEYLMGDNNSGNNLEWAIALAQNINDVMQADMNAYVWWTMVRYYGPIADGNKASNPEDPREIYPAKGTVTKKGYVMSQFSKFIRPGFYRVQSSLAPALRDVELTAYKDPSSSRMIIIAINSGSEEIEHAFRIENKMITTSITPYTTSGTKNFVQEDPVDVVNSRFDYTLEPQSITTFVSD